MLEEGQLKKYLVYAFGEILLITIGILVALQINNLNEKSKSRVQEVNILRELKSDLEANLVEIIDLETRLTRRENDLDSIRVYFEEQRPLNNSLRGYFEDMTFVILFNNATTTYEYIRSSGINILQNDSLRVMISEMYEGDFRNIHFGEDYDLKYNEQTLRPFFLENFRASPAARKGWRENGWQTLNEPRNVDLLRNDQMFLNILADRKRMIAIRRRNFGIRIPKLESLIKEVEKEIDRIN